MNRVCSLGVMILALLSACKNSPRHAETVAAVLSKQKAKCVVCRAPSSRTALLLASYKTTGRDLSPTVQDMVLVKGGLYRMGSEEFSDSRPVHSVQVKSFYMDVHEVTNTQFAAFVKATGYITVAEQKLNPKDYPGVPADKLVPGSAVFTPPTQPVGLDNPMQWWT